MKKMLVTLVLAGVLMVPALPAQAKRGGGGMENINFGRITCDQFMEEIADASEEDIGAVFLWLDGYLSGVSGDVVLKWNGLERFAEKLVQRCSDRGGEKLLDAARRVGIE